MAAMVTKVFGITREKLPLISYSFGHSQKRILILGGVHGDEPEGVVLCKYLLTKFLQSFPFALEITIVPEFNPEGILRKTRQNSAGVDLNRNLPTKSWTLANHRGPRYHPGTRPASEPETGALISLLDELSPDLIISCHSYFPMINPNGDCLEEASILSKLTGYRVEPDMGYPHPGDLGTYAGKERNLKTITLEVERHLEFKKIPELFWPAFRELFYHLENR